MSQEQGKFSGDIRNSPLFSEDLAPVPPSGRTWNTWHLAALWVGMAVCITTYLLASYMIRSGLGWVEALVIIGLANIVITLPMVLNGHPGVKYGLPFPVVGRAAFGTLGVHIPSIMRGLVACGWFGVQTWIGGLAIYEIGNALVGAESVPEITFGKMVSFAIFWVINMYFIWKGTESIRWLEEYSAPILIIMGVLLIGWGAVKGGGFSHVLDHSKHLGAQSFVVNESGQELSAQFTLLPGKDDQSLKAREYRILVERNGQVAEFPWTDIPADRNLGLSGILTAEEWKSGKTKLFAQFRAGESTSSKVKAVSSSEMEDKGSKLWSYILWFTAMVGYWATMSISISDITRYAKSQKAQIAGQFIGLPGTMILYSFVGIFVTCAASLIFPDILVAEDAPWDPVSLLARFESPVVVIVAQIFMLIATLSTNIAANVIAPANAISNLLPRHISFRMGGIITGIIGIIICPWWLMDSISSILIFVSGLLGPVLGILLADYFLVRRKHLDVEALFRVNGAYSFSGGVNVAALVALAVGVFSALIGLFVPKLSWLYSLSWFTGFGVSFVLYYVLMRKVRPVNL